MSMSNLVNTCIPIILYDASYLRNMAFLLAGTCMAMSSSEEQRSGGESKVELCIVARLHNDLLVHV